MHIERPIAQRDVNVHIELSEHCIGNLGEPRVACIGNWEVTAFERTVPNGDTVIEAMVHTRTTMAGQPPGAWDYEPRIFESRAEYMDFLAYLQQHDVPPFHIVSGYDDSAA